MSFDKVASASTLPQFPQQVSTAVTMHFKFSYHVSELRTTKTGYHLQLPIKAFYARVHRQFLACCVASNAIYKNRSDVHQDGSKCKNYTTNILNRQNENACESASRPPDWSTEGDRYTQNTYMTSNKHIPIRGWLTLRTAFESKNMIFVLSNCSALRDHRHNMIVLICRRSRSHKHTQNTYMTLDQKYRFVLC